MDTEQIYLKPDWVIIGAGEVPEGGKVMVIASSNLSKANVMAKWEEVEAFFKGMICAHVSRFSYYEISMRAGSVVIAAGDTYEEALATIFKQWCPDGNPQISSQLALPS